MSLLDTPIDWPAHMIPKHCGHCGSKNMFEAEVTKEGCHIYLCAVCTKRTGIFFEYPPDSVMRQPPKPQMKGQMNFNWFGVWG